MTIRGILILAVILSESYKCFASNASLKPSELKKKPIEYRNHRIDSDFFVSERLDEFKQNFLGYEIKISSGESFCCALFEIRKNGKVVYSSEDLDLAKFNLVSHQKNDRREYLLNLTGSGPTQIAVSASTGGVHCCHTLLIFDLGDELKKIAEIEGGNFEPVLIDLDHDGIPEIRITDDCFSYKFGSGSFGGSPIGTVILKFSQHQGRYVLAEELMRKPPPREKYISRHLSKWQKGLRTEDSDDWPPSTFLQTLTDIVYTGHADLAVKFLNRVWPAEIPGKNKFWKKYKAALSRSVYYSKVAENL